ncbi:aminoglycoside phosphotransferase family protein [Actinomadura sp. B10D3]|uniref:phosphotransferase family protein n=1 Tax=Actinomadura sp. B10D3 TaxID=3153557 RepID=UPI00325EF32F
MDKFTRLVTEADSDVARNLLERDPKLVRQLHVVAKAQPRVFNGAFHRNVRVGNLLVRSPVAYADRLDLRLIPECDVLRAIKPHLGNRATRLVYEGEGWSVHMFDEGRLLHEVAPPNRPVPPLTLWETADLFSELAKVRWQELPLHLDWPADGDSVAFGRRLAAYVAKHNRPEFRLLGIPDEPLEHICFERTTSRPFQLLHNDLHRRNVIIRPDNHAVVVDWEMALVGDPVYEMATHLHYMGYSEEEQETVLRYWLEKMPPSSTEGWQSDLQVYLQFNQVKSAINDTSRVFKKIREGTLPSKAIRSMIADLTAVLNTAGRVWGQSTPREVDYVANVLRDFWSERG